MAWKRIGEGRPVEYKPFRFLVYTGVGIEEMYGFMYSGQFYFYPDFPQELPKKVPEGMIYRWDQIEKAPLEPSLAIKITYEVFSRDE